MSTVFLTSCEGENEDSENPNNLVPTGIHSVTEIPGDFASGTAYKVDFYVNNGCGNFLLFDETIDGNTRTIKVIAKYEGEICTMDVPLREATYTFDPVTAGTYTLKFLMEDGTYQTETFVVQ